MKLYILYSECRDYGSLNSAYYIIGIFDSKEKMLEAKKEGNMWTEIELNEEGWYEL
jgi:hypothetical protein